MGAPPKQNDMASRERKPQRDQLKGEASTLRELERSRARNTLFDSPVVDENVIGLLRAGAVLIVFFQLVYAAEHRYTSASTFDATLSLHLINIAIGVVFFLLTFTAAMPRYWREIAIFVCTALLVSTTAIGAESMRIEPLFVSVLVIVVGAGTLVPWDWRWQAAISDIGMICFYVLTRAHGVVDSDPSMHWLGLMTAVGLAQSNVYLQMKNRRETRAKPRRPVEQRSASGTETHRERRKVPPDFRAKRRHGGGHQPRYQRDPRGQQPIRQTQPGAAGAGVGPSQCRFQFFRGAGYPRAIHEGTPRERRRCKTSRSSSTASAMRGR